jgi:hypothetical protein
MFDGYFSFSNRKGAYSVCLWFDEYSVDLQTGKAGRNTLWKGYLGSPLGPAFNADKPSEILKETLMSNSDRAEKKVWRRDFKNGVVLVNPGKSAQEISLNGRFKKISGTIDPAFNNGASLTRITLKGSEGVVLLRDSTTGLSSLGFEGAPVRRPNSIHR